MSEPLGTRSLRELLRIVFARRRAIVLILIVLTGATLAACLKATKVYESSVTFLAREPRPQNPTAQPVSTDRSLEVFIKTQYELVTSDVVLSRTLVAMDEPDSPLVREWEAVHAAVDALDRAPTTTQPDAGVALEQQRMKLAADLHSVLVRLDDEVERRLSDPAGGESFREQLRRFAKRVKVETPGGEQIALSEIFRILVTVPGPPMEARRAADLLARHYIDRYREVQAELGGRSAEFIRTRLEAYKRQRLAPAEANLRAFLEQELDSPSDLAILEQLSKSGTEAGRQIVVRRFQEESITLDAELAGVLQIKQQLLEQLPAKLWGDKPRTDSAGRLTVPDVANLAEDRISADDPALIEATIIIPEETLKNNIVINQLKSKEVALIVEVNRLEVEYKADYRGVKDKLAEIANTRRQILREIIGEASARDIAAAILSARQDEIRRKIEDETHRLDRISRQLVRYQELQHEIRVAREEHSRMSADLSSAEQFENQEAGSITIAVIDPARVPDVRRPAFPNTPLYVSLAAVVALLMGVAYAFVADYYDHTFRSIAEAERYLGVPVVGSIGTRRKGLLRRL